MFNIINKAGGRGIVAVAVSRIGPVQVFCLLFILCVFCVTATHIMRNDSHDVFRFNAGGGTALREGATGGGCEPKDIVALGDRLSSDSFISGIEQTKEISNAINKSTDAKIKSAWENFQQFAVMAKGAATMRSKPDEQMIRKVMAEGAAKKNIDCAAFSELTKGIETVAGLSADQKNAIKKYTTEMVNMGQCLGWCK
jgi:hypothetical protein